MESLGLTTIISELKWIGGDGRWLEGIAGLRKRIPKLIKIIDDRKIDLVYSNSSVVLDGAIAAKIRGIPHIWHVHEGPMIGIKGLMKRIVRSFLITSLSEKVITISQGSKRFFSLFGTKKICTVYNGVDVKSFDPPVPIEFNLRQELGLIEEYPVVALIGSFLENKGQMDLVEAARLINGQGIRLHYLLVGDGNRHYINQLKEKVKGYDLSDSFKFLGFRTDIPYILRNIDLFVLASRREPFGRVISEAMASAKPVVATMSGGPEEIVLDKITGFLIPTKSPKDLANAIMGILSLPDKGKEMGQHGRKRIEEFFSFKAYQNGITKIIRDVLKQDLKHFNV